MRLAGDGGEATRPVRAIGREHSTRGTAAYSQGGGAAG